MRQIVTLDKWYLPNANADLITLGTNKFWFRNSNPIAFELESVYRLRGTWGYENCYDSLPSHHRNDRTSTENFVNYLYVYFADLFQDEAYYPTPMHLHKYAGPRAKASQIVIGDVSLWFSYEWLVAFRRGLDGVLYVSENPGKATTRKHIGFIVDQDAPRLNRIQFFGKLGEVIPELKAGGRMIWLP